MPGTSPGSPRLGTRSGVGLGAVPWMPTRPLAPDRALPLPTRPHGRGAGGSPPAAPLGAELAAGMHRPLPVGFPCWGSRNDTETPSAPRIYPPAAHFRKRSGAGAFRRALRLPIHSAPAAPPAASRPRAADAGPAVPGGGGAATTQQHYGHRPESEERHLENKGTTSTCKESK
nr:translation initiation factor IF-2-like [Anas platyrhynchos]